MLLLFRVKIYYICPFRLIYLLIVKCYSLGFFPLAMANVDTETTDSWEWFFMLLTNILMNERPITFIFDRNTGLLEALPKVLPNAYHYLCLQHL